MKIELITIEEHEELLKIHAIHPNLTLQNTGYEGINKDSLTGTEIESIERIEDILKKAIKGFIKFQNFRSSNKSAELQIRFQYNYNYDGGGNSFTGVGYILVDELLHGFRD